MFLNGRNIKWTQFQSKHGICPKLGALGKYFQFISMNKSIANWNYLFAGIGQGLIQQSASTSSQSYSHSKDRFFKKTIHCKSFKNKKTKKKKKKKKEIFKKRLGTRGIGLVILRPLSKKKKIHQSNFFKFLQNFKISKFFKKKIQNFQFLQKIQVFKIQKKKKIFVKFFFRNRKLWSSSTFSSDATSSQLSTLSIHWSMEYVPN